MTQERLSADEIIELGRDRKPVPVYEIRGVLDAWHSKLRTRVTGLVGLQEHLGADDGGRSFMGWASQLGNRTPVLANASQGERWEAVRRTAYELLGVAQSFVRDHGAYLSRESDEALGMEMDRLLLAIDRAEQMAKPLRREVRQAVDGLALAAVLDLAEASTSLSGLLPKRKGT